MLLEEKTTMTDDFPRATYKWGKQSGKTTGGSRKTLLLRRSLHRTKREKKETSPLISPLFLTRFSHLKLMGQLYCSLLSSLPQVSQKQRERNIVLPALYCRFGEREDKCIKTQKQRQNLRWEREGMD